MPLPNPDTTIPMPQVEQGVPKPNVEVKPVQPQGETEAEMVVVIDTNAQNPDAVLKSLAEFHDEQEILQPADAITEAQQIIKASVNSTVKEISAADISIQEPLIVQQQAEPEGTTQEMQPIIEPQDFVNKDNVSIPENVDQVNQTEPKEAPIGLSFDATLSAIRAISETIKLQSEEVVVEPGGTSSETLEKMKNSIFKMKEIKTIVYADSENKNNLFKSLEDAQLNNQADLQNIDDILSNASQVVSRRADFIKAEKQTRLLRDKYIEQTLRENGIESQGQFWEEHDAVNKRLHELKKGRLGVRRLTHGDEIGILEARKETLNVMSSEFYPVDLNYSSDEEYSNESFANIVVNKTVNIVRDHYETRIEEMEGHVPKENELEGQVIEPIENDYLEKFVRPELISRKPFYKELTDNVIEQAIQVIKASDLKNFELPVKNRIEDINSLPTPIKALIKDMYPSHESSFNLNYPPRYAEMFKFVQSYRLQKNYSELVGDYANIQDKLLLNSQGLRVDTSTSYSFQRRNTRDIKGIDPDKFSSSLWGNEIPRWKIFIESDSIKKLFPAPLIGDISQEVQNNFIDKTIDIVNRNGSSVTVKDSLQHFVDPRNAELNVLNIMRESIHRIQGLSNYVGKLPEETISYFDSHPNYPASILIKFIKENPDSFQYREDVDTEIGQTVPNPKFYETYKLATNMAFDLAQRGSESEKLFALRCLQGFEHREFTNDQIDALVTHLNLDFPEIDNIASGLLSGEAFFRENSYALRLALFNFDALDTETQKGMALELSRKPDVIKKAMKELSVEGIVPLNITNALLKSVRSSDPLFSSNPEHQPEENTFRSFNSAYNELLKELDNPESLITKNAEMFSSFAFLKFIARQPEKYQETINLTKTNPEFFKLIASGGPLYSNVANVSESIFSNGNAIRRVREIETIFTKKVPYWKQLYLFTDTRLGDQLAAAQTEYPISEISGVSLVRLAQRYKELKAIDPNILTRLETAIDNKDTLGKLVNGNIENVPFKDFSGMYKKLIFRDFLRRSIETSRSSGAKDDADRRNRKSVMQNFELKPEMYLHGFYSNNFDNILLSGNLPGEALGEMASNDSYPFQVDFTRITSDHLSRHNNLNEQVLESLSGSYGDGTYLAYERNDTSWEAGKNAYGGGNYHALLLGGMPATEISAVLLKNPEVLLEKAKKSVVENGFYIPIYDLSGNLLLTSQEYDSIRAENNLDIPVEVWDYSLKTGEQLGSNPGGEFTIPEMGGPEKYYVKFVDPENWEHMWSEELTDNIYRQLGVPTPETKIVKVSGTYGHASKVLPVDEVQNQDDLKNGFVADALLANWDAVYNSANNLVSGGRTYRIDNGGSLFFRARGERKTDEMFGEVVNELQNGTDRERLGLGMRQMYPGLTDEDIRQQAETMKTSLTDFAIDNVVNSVRLPKTERGQIASTLKKRRDYILAQVIPSAA